MGKLSIYFGLDGNRLNSPSAFFNVNFTNDWLNNDFARKVLKEIEGVEILGTRHYVHPYFGDISPRELSGSVKALLILYNLPDKIVLIDLARMGQNCVKYLEDILKEKDLTLSCNTMLTAIKDIKVEGICENDQTTFNIWQELLEKHLYWMDQSPMRNIPEGWDV